MIPHNAAIEQRYRGINVLTPGSPVIRAGPPTRRRRTAVGRSTRNRAGGTGAFSYKRIEVDCDAGEAADQASVVSFCLRSQGMVRGHSPRAGLTTLSF